jgi:hypothetical protein
MNNYKSIATININTNGLWNPDTHNIVLSKSNDNSGFTVKMVEINTEVPITSLQLANNLLEKFRLNK